MENTQKPNLEKVPNLDMRALLLSNFGLSTSRVSDETEYFRLPEDFPYNSGAEILETNSTESLVSYFEGMNLLQSDAVCRTSGDTTLFTTSGVQKIETIDKSHEGLKKENFIIFQPVIRSQFMDKIKEGTSSSFVNFSVELIDCTQNDFIWAVNKLIGLFSRFGIKKDELEFTIKDDIVKWGSKRFENTSIKAYFNGVELGECVYIHNYPVSDSKKIAITDLGFGIERFFWGIDCNNPYFSGFDDIYEKFKYLNRDEITSIIDPIRSMALIAGDGIRGSNNNHGYRLRQFSKRFVKRNKTFKLDDMEIVQRALSYWKQWGYVTKIEDKEIEEVVGLENQRNYNMLFLTTLKDILGIDLYIEVNQPSKSFLKQIHFSLSDEQVDKILKLI